ncbi:hypothetical protein [Thalassotalea sp. PLHSN55]|uniref:hypothetical protein n=1 Tax=Thalassotalea sp. PLHSN55 TaxID=3435888 RepID=UPI003F8302C2
MTTIETIKSAINETMDHAQMKVQALKLQASLGKADLEDNIQEKRKVAVKAAAELSKHLESIGVTANDVKDSINSELENLQVQVTLGKMESKEAIEKSKDVVTKCAGQFESVLEKAQSIEAEKVEQVKVKLSDYMTKMSDLKASIEANVESYKA